MTKLPNWLSPRHKKPQWLSLPFGAASGPRSVRQSARSQNVANTRVERPRSKERIEPCCDSWSEKPHGDEQHVEKTRKSVAYTTHIPRDPIEDATSPIRWFIVCTLFPLLASTFGPMASAFNICAVAIDWRTRVIPSSTQSEGPKIDDPRWLVAVNATSLALAIIANLFLLAQMAGRIRFSIGSPVTIVLWYISGFIDVALVVAAPTVMPLPTDTLAAYSQAYYYACFAGALYILLALMLSCTAIGIWVYHFTDEFKLTLSQRSLMLQTMLYLGYVLCAAAVYSTVENRLYLDMVYFVNVSIFTIGLGDMVPKTHAGRALIFPTAVGGIVFVGLIIANIRSLVLESCSRKISLRVVEKARHTALARGDPAERIVKLRGTRSRIISGDTELERRREEFNVMREILGHAAVDNKRITLAASAAAFFILWLVGAVVFWQAEMAVGGQNWTYFESLYFTYVGLLTIGYGDFHPQTNSAKPAFVFWSLIALPTLTILVGSLGDVVSDAVNILLTKISSHSVELHATLKSVNRTVHRRSKPDPEPITPSHSHEVAAQHEASLAVSDHISLMSPDTIVSEPKWYDPTCDEAVHAYKPYLVIKEIKKLVADIDADPNKAYPFSEWTRLLQLIDEDESTTDGHRVPGKSEHEPLTAVSPPVQHSKAQAWSWLGQESPLMSTDSEPKWLMDRLLEVLEKELKYRGDQLIIQKVVSASPLSLRSPQPLASALQAPDDSLAGRSLAGRLETIGSA